MPPAFGDNLSSAILVPRTTTRCFRYSPPSHQGILGVRNVRNVPLSEQLVVQLGLVTPELTWIIWQCHQATSALPKYEEQREFRNVSLGVFVML